MKERIIITGGAGFIGSNLARCLTSEGFHAVVLDNLLAGTLGNVPTGVEFHQVDICEMDLEPLFEGASTVFHLAAKNCLADCAAHPEETARVNVYGTARVLKASVAVGIPHLVYADTSAEYEGIEEFPTPTSVVKPRSLYACSKRGGALFCEAFSHALSVTVLRYFNVYGPAQDWRRVIPPVMSAFTLKLLSGLRPTIFGTGEKRRDFIHVDDVNAFHLRLLMDPKIQGGVYNLGTGKDHSVREIFDAIESELRTGLKPAFSDDLPAEAFRTLADITDTVRTGWEPRVELQHGLQRFINYTKTRLSEESHS